MADDKIEFSYKNPNFPPYIEPGFNGTWIEIESIGIKHQTAFIESGKNDKGGLVLSGEKGPSWKFLAPNQIMETVNNSWEPWETISSRLAGKGQEAIQMSNEIVGIYGALKELKGGFSLNTVANTYKSLTNISKAKFKVDTPLVYENSERREWIMEFNLVSIDGEGCIDMMQAVRDLELFSLPTRTKDYAGLGIDLPFVFSIKSAPNSLLINVEFAALISVQPTFKSPYDEQGLPIMIDLTLTFKELPPLYSDSINLGD